MLIHMSSWTVLKDLVKKNCLIKNVFTALQKMEQLGDYHDNYLKKYVLLLADVLKSLLIRA